MNFKTLAEGIDYLNEILVYKKKKFYLNNGEPITKKKVKELYGSLTGGQRLKSGEVKDRSVLNFWLKSKERKPKKPTDRKLKRADNKQYILFHNQKDNEDRKTIH